MFGQEMFDLAFKGGWLQKAENGECEPLTFLVTVVIGVGAGHNVELLGESYYQQIVSRYRDGYDMCSLLVRELWIERNG